MAKMKYRDFNEYLLEKLQDPEMALGYLNEASKDEDQRVLLLALKNVLEAQGGDLSAVAAQAHMSRQNLYKILSAKGNPQLSSLKSILHVMGYTLAQCGQRPSSTVGCLNNRCYRYATIRFSDWYTPLNAKTT